MTKQAECQFHPDLREQYPGRHARHANEGPHKGRTGHVGGFGQGLNRRWLGWVSQQRLPTGAQALIAEQGEHAGLLTVGG